tara:strand:- start:260 stop:727 length:468 start_codon:yes stop_codon:yes gene_type:complete
LDHCYYKKRKNISGGIISTRATRMFDPTRFLKYARGRLKLWADFHKDYVSFVSVFQKLPETELASLMVTKYISHLRKRFTQHKFISAEIAFVRSAPVEYLDLVRKVKLCTETELDEIIEFYDGVFALSEMSKKEKNPGGNSFPPARHACSIHHVS